MSKLDDVPTRKSGKRRRTIAPNENVSKPGTTDAAKMRNTLKKGFKPSCEIIHGMAFGPNARTPAAETSAIKQENSNDESSALSEIEKPTEANIYTMLSQAKNASKVKTKADRKHFDCPPPTPTCSTPRPSATGIPPFLANWAKARPCDGFTLQESAIYLRENSDAEKFNKEPTLESEAHIFATKDGAGETEPCEDGDATEGEEEEEYYDADSEAPTQENTNRKHN
jgi:hypothetical protein